MTTRYRKAALARKRWSLNAVRKRERNRIAQAAAPPAVEGEGKCFVPKRRGFDLKVNLERRDGGRVQFTLHHFYGKLIGGSVNLTPKQFGRKLGEIFELWMMD